MSESSEINEGYNGFEDFRQCGAKIRELLADGDEISDELYV